MQEQPDREYKEAGEGDCLPPGEGVPGEKPGGVVYQEDRKQVHDKDLYQDRQIEDPPKDHDHRFAQEYPVFYSDVEETPGKHEDAKYNANMRHRPEEE